MIRDEPVIINQDHWLENTRRSYCQNYNDRPGGIDDISLIIIHCISLPNGQYGGDCIDRLFANRLDPMERVDFSIPDTMRVSSHLLIRRSGALTQYVSFEKRAWHAGVSVYQGRENCNDFSIGIEMEGVDDSSFEQVQYVQLVRVSRALIARYPSLAGRQFAGHSEVARPVGRKSDPGSGFDWQQFLSML